MDLHHLHRGQTGYYFRQSTSVLSSLLDLVGALDLQTLVAVITSEKRRQLAKS